MKSYEAVPRVEEEDDPREPVGFRLCGEEFRCVLPEAPAWARAKLTNGRYVTADSLIDFIIGCLVPGLEPRFLELLQNKDLIVPISTLGDIADDIVEQYTNRPFRSPPSSANGPPTDEPSSTGASSSMVAANAT